MLCIDEKGIHPHQPTGSETRTGPSQLEALLYWKLDRTRTNEHAVHDLAEEVSN